MSDSSFTQQTYPSLSVVIPTLGGETLRGTIEQLNRGTLVPTEILVCIPEEGAFRVENLSYPNVRVLKTRCRGQVAQRAIGFQLSANPFVLQLDDDILVRETCLEHLVEVIMVDDHVAVGPSFFDFATGEYHGFQVPANKKQSLFEKLMYWIINGAKGYQPGQIGISGVNMGVPKAPDDWSNLGWLSGGCLLHRRQNLVLFDFYPFKGKAFAEDLFHSKLLRENGIRMMRCGSAICDVDFSSSSYKGISYFVRDYCAYAHQMTKFVKGCSGSTPRLYLYLLCNLVRLAARKLHKFMNGTCQ